MAAIESLDGAGELLGRADELLERAESAARSAGLVDLSAGCRTRRTALRRQHRAIGQLVEAHLCGRLTAAGEPPRSGRGRARSRLTRASDEAYRAELAFNAPDDD